MLKIMLKIIRFEEYKLNEILKKLFKKGKS